MTAPRRAPPGTCRRVELMELPGRHRTVLLNDVRLAMETCGWTALPIGSSRRAGIAFRIEGAAIGRAAPARL